MVGYGRADYRMNKNGEIVYLEMNSNASCFFRRAFGSTDLIL